jgi:hypothetical protein
MSIKRYIASKDTTITNAFRENLTDRATEANTGGADSLEVFSILGQSTTSSLEKSRILVEFPINQIVSDRNSNLIPSSGSVSFYLRMFNVEHPFTVPRDFSMNIAPISGAWVEGYGMDLDSYSDYGFSLEYNGEGSNWLFSSRNYYWFNSGGDYYTGSYILSQSFALGIEDIELDVTDICEKWLNNTIENNGFIIFLSGSAENGTTNESFFTKKFSARTSEFFFNRPCLEARWNPSVTDDRLSFYASSSLLSADDNKMNIYFYNKVNNSLKNIVNNPNLTVKFFSDSAYTQQVSSSYLLVSVPSQGIYRASVAIDTTASVLYDKWYNSSSLAPYFSSSFDVYQRTNYDYDDDKQYVLNLTNLKSSYFNNEQAKIKVFVRDYDWQPTIYTKAYDNIENTIIPNLYYKIFRFNDNYTVINYSTGSLAYTKTSYDSNGNYFDIDMNILEKDYGYGIKLATWDGKELKEFKNIFKFRVH